MAWGVSDVHREAAAHRLAAEFGSTIPPETIVRELDASFSRWTGAKITMYVPVLAERAARERLIALSRGDKELRR